MTYREHVTQCVKRGNHIDGQKGPGGSRAPSNREFDPAEENGEQKQEFASLNHKEEEWEKEDRKAKGGG